MKHPVRSANDIASLQFGAEGLVPVIVQDEPTGAVLMLAWADAEALQRTLDSGSMVYWSRSREAYWRKGETSGNTQKLIALAADCDQDAVLATVRQEGPACHENTGTCWTDRPDVPVATRLGVLDRLATDRLAAPAGRYTDRLLADAELAANSLEEAGEVAAVLRGEDNDDHLEHEAADLLYHLIVALRGGGSQLSAVLAELAARDD